MTISGAQAAGTIGRCRKISGRTHSRPSITESHAESGSGPRSGASGVQEWSKELSQGNAESAGELCDGTDADISFATLYATYVISVQIGTLGQLLLRDLQAMAQMTDTTANCGL